MKFTAMSFTCPSCGAPQKFSPTKGMLVCEFCKSETAIDPKNQPIMEYGFHQALSNLEKGESKPIEKEVSCKKCGSSFTLTPYSFSSNCPYCDTPAITDFVQEITPKSMVPFKIGQKDARSRFEKWVKSRWFAPTAFKKYLDGNESLTGYYLPYWTYDSDTVSQYTGLRGDVYYVTVTKTVVENGKQRNVRVQEARTRWTAASGTAYVNFDDVTVGASKSVSRAILSALEPWDTTQLLPFDEKYLSGFEAEEYSIGLDNGFEFAKTKMYFKIEQKIRYQIGGDKQQIHSVNTQYNNTTYKNILLPVWTASFKWNNKTYNYAINALTGKVVGERPYSPTKIFFAILGASGVVGSVVYFEEIKVWINGLMVGM